jgi:3'(2'), 5'-bisphosphate nucleotidase
MPNVTVISEETCEAPHDVTLPDRFVLVDPLDGTREFKAGHDEFTVNIALIEAGQPIASALYAPALHRLYLASYQAFRADVRPYEALPRLESMRKIDHKPPPRNGIAGGGRPLPPRSRDPALARRAAD